MNAIRHELDYAPEVVGVESDWYKRDDEGNVISLDEYGRPIPYDPFWVEARKNANGKQYDCLSDGTLVGACIGGSSASICAGIFPGHEDGCLENTFNSKLSLYHALRNEEPKYKVEDSHKETIFQIGHDFENAVSLAGIREINQTYFSEKGLKGWLVNDTRMFRCGVLNEAGNLRFPHAISDLDRLIYVYPKDVIPKMDDNDWLVNNPPVEKYGFEIKTTRRFSNGYGHWEKSTENPIGVPENYQVQTHHYMAVNNLDGFFVAVQAYSMLPQDLLVRFVPRDINLEIRILENEETFIQNALNGIEPSALSDIPLKRFDTMAQYTEAFEEVKKTEGFLLEGDESIKAVYKIVDIDEQIAAIEESSKKQIASLTNERKLLEATLFDSFSEDNKSYAYLKGTKDNTAGCFFIRQNHKKGRAVTNIDALEKENPSLAALCVKKSAVLSGLTAAQKEEIKKYQSTPIKAEIETSISFVADKPMKKEA